MGKLTGLQVKNANKPGRIGDGDGLYLQVARNGSKSWIFRFRINGKQRDHGLGPVNTLSLAEAREAARECRKLRLQGLDPVDVKKERQVAARIEAAKSISFRDCAKEYIEAHKSAWKNKKHTWQWDNSLSKYAHPVVGDMPVGAVDVELVLKVLRPIWETKTETATRVRGRMELLLDYAKACGYRDGENPARWKGNLSHMLPAKGKIAKVKHLPALPYAEIGGFWQELSQQPGMGALALRFTILTAARSGEVFGATWDEIDMENAVWTVPEERMKAGKEHRVPLSPQALAILREAQEHRRGDFVFPGARTGKPLSDMAMTTVLRRMERGDITVHGFRSTFRDWTAERTETPREVAEAALAHTLENKVEAAYRRSDLFDKRRDLMEAWGAYCVANR